MQRRRMLEIATFLVVANGFVLSWLAPIFAETILPDSIDQIR